MNINDLLAIPRERLPDKIALSYKDDATKTAFTYAQLHEAVDRLAAGLVEWGLEPRDRVAFFLSNRPEFVIAYLAVLQVGAIATPINLRYRRHEIGHILNDSTPRLVITEHQYLPVLEDASYRDTSVEATIIVEELSRWQADIPTIQQQPVQGEDVASIIYTSVTTGTSKGATLSLMPGGRSDSLAPFTVRTRRNDSGSIQRRINAIFCRTNSLRTTRRCIE